MSVEETETSQTKDAVSDSEYKGEGEDGSVSEMYEDDEMEEDYEMGETL